MTQILITFLLSIFLCIIVYNKFKKSEYEIIKNLLRRIYADHNLHIELYDNGIEGKTIRVPISGDFGVYQLKKYYNLFFDKNGRFLYTTG